MKFVERSRLLVVGVAVRASWNELWDLMPETWQEFFSRCSEIDHQLGHTYCDISLNEEDGSHLQFICAPVTRVEHVPEGMSAVEIPAQSYLHYRHPGPTNTIAEAFGRMYERGRKAEVGLGALKIDRGYTPAGNEAWHDLYIGMLPETPWRYVKRTDAAMV